MANFINYTPIFINKAKKLKKRHISLTDDLEKLEEYLLNNPSQGIDLGSVFIN